MSIIQDLPVSVGSALGVSGASDQFLVGGLVLSSAILFGVVLALNATKTIKLPGQIITLFAVCGVLVAIGWLQAWILIVGFCVVGAMFGGQIAAWVGRWG